MSTKTVKTRIQNKQDSEANWKLVENLFIPLNGEIIVYTYEDVNKPAQIKVGDGRSYLKDLHFVNID